VRRHYHPYPGTGTDFLANQLNGRELVAVAPTPVYPMVAYPPPPPPWYRPPPPWWYRHPWP
jgi:hypothetical protein